MSNRCEKCNQINATNPFSFYYGKKMGNYGQYTVGTKVLRTSYTISGQQEVWLCSKCARRSKLDWLNLGIYLAIILVLGALIFLLWPKVQSAWLILILFLVFIIGGSVLELLKTIFKSAQTIGEEQAITCKRKALEATGQDSFWTTKDYLKLHKS